MPHALGIRRQREDSSSLEIEELDSYTMRQNSYNYFQRHRFGSGPLRTSTFRSSLGCGPPSRKRQRTLAEQLDDLCLEGTNDEGVSSSLEKRRRDWRLAKDQARGGTRFIELEGMNQQEISSIGNSNSDSDGMDITEETTGLKACGDAVNGIELSSILATGVGDRHRTMERMYRHYVTVAANPTSTERNLPQGKEIVIFNPQKQVKTLLPAYLSMTPHDFERLSFVEKRQWSRYMREREQSTVVQKNKILAGEQIEAKPVDPDFESRAPTSEARIRCSYPDKSVEFVEDVEMMENDVSLKCPHAAGALTHTKWFMDNEV
ncbi:uncharacterized protein PHALS_01278 [Plasmopara halstedii]|uniref:Uncharacterized protein n=1 Tax=Plasmopara halstedii TaxID=4781 RepID=A0A0N7L6Q8_PLAHL|nr:uncharacterized protein PHALS_01278 [Plasmopara halstedii]CEG44955.1 hypothetical protein PHALS_01278 [Plasmopara halstedii]|eukprot:XP_024581324.1 hypothetical protein PHALS_01278 [Plasmopara halstedii]